MNTRRLRARLDRLEAVVTYTPEELERFCNRLYELTIRKRTPPYGLDNKQEAEFARLQVICRGMDIYKTPEWFVMKMRASAKEDLEIARKLREEE